LEVAVSDALDRARRWDAAVGVDDAVARAVAEERAAVVAWLRMSPAEGEQLTRVMYEAEAIERGEHRSEVKP
jgi:hypothetical protein